MRVSKWSSVLYSMVHSSVIRAGPATFGKQSFVDMHLEFCAKVDNPHYDVGIRNGWPCVCDLPPAGDSAGQLRPRSLNDQINPDPKVPRAELESYRTKHSQGISRYFGACPRRRRPRRRGFGVHLSTKRLVVVVDLPLKKRDRLKLAAILARSVLQFHGS